MSQNIPKPKQNLDFGQPSLGDLGCRRHHENVEQHFPHQSPPSLRSKGIFLDSSREVKENFNHQKGAREA